MCVCVCVCVCEREGEIKGRGGAVEVGCIEINGNYTFSLFFLIAITNGLS